MVSKLSLGDRVEAWSRQPAEELTAWSIVNSKRNAYFDDRALRYYDPPRFRPGSEVVDLSFGLQESTFADAYKTSAYLDCVLRAMMHVEYNQGHRIDAKIVTWGKIMSRILALSQGYTNELLLENNMEFDVVGFDGQIFICHSLKKPPAHIQRATAVCPPMEKYTYSEYTFEQVSTLPKPLSQCTRQDFEKKYSSMPRVEDLEEYRLLVKTGINNIGILLGTGVDCVDGLKDPKDKLKNYINLKAAMSIAHMGAERSFERKLLKTWLDSFLADIPRILYGFRDHNLKLLSIREFRTANIPRFVETSRVLAPDERWNADDVMDFYAKLCEWLKAEVKDGETYKLTYKRFTPELVLRRTPLEVHGRRLAFLSDEFVQWRDWLRQQDSA